MSDNTYYIISAANIQMDTLMKAVNTAYGLIGGTFGPVFNIDGTKTLVQIKFSQTPPPNINQNSLLVLPQLSLKANLSTPEWQSRIYPPDSLNSNYFSGAINLGQYLTQVRAIPPR